MRSTGRRRLLAAGVVVLALLLIAPTVRAGIRTAPSAGPLAEQPTESKDGVGPMPTAIPAWTDAGRPVALVSPLTGERYAVQKDLAQDVIRLCSLRDSICYGSVSDVLQAEASSLPAWARAVDPNLRVRLETLGSEPVRIIVEFEDPALPRLAEAAWSAARGELQVLLEEWRRSEGVDDPDGVRLKALSGIDARADAVRASILAEAEAGFAPRVREFTRVIEGLHGTVYGHTPVLPAVFASVPASTIPALALKDGVGRISEDSLMEADLDVSAPAIFADTFWSNGYTGGVWDLAIVDTGIDGTHPALQVDFAGVFHDVGQTYPFYGDDPSSTDDLHSHGTHVAGITASTDATYRGVAYGLDALINAKAGWRTTSGGGVMDWADGMEAIDWAIGTAGADIVSLSFGGSPGVGDTAMARYFDAVVDSLGVVVAVSAGNSGSGSGTVTEPANAFNILAVGAMDDRNTVGRSDDVIASYSSRGPTGDGRLKPDIAAPGSRIVSTYSGWETGPDFVSNSGTSMAAPHVAASAALVLDGVGTVTPLVVKAILLQTAEDRGSMGPDTAYGWGYLNLAQAYGQRFTAVNGSVPDAGGRYVFYRGAVATGDRATLVWNRHAVYAGPIVPTTWYNLNDLDLFAYDETDTARLGASTSAVDNVEQVVAAGDVASLVYKVKAFGALSGVSSEPFAFAVKPGVLAVEPPSLSVGLTLPPAAELGDVFTVDAVVANSGELRAHAVSVSLNLPAGLSLVSGASPQILGTIDAGTNAIASWQVRGDLQGAWTVTVRADSDSYEETFTASSAPASIDVQDTRAPISAVDLLPPWELGAVFPVTATASDANGLASVELFYNRDGGPWNPYGIHFAPPWSWAFDTSTTGGDGMYEFYTIATDLAANVEAAPSVPDASTAVDTVEPASAVDPLPSYSTASIVPVTVVASDANGIASVDLFYRKDGGPWALHATAFAPPWSWMFDTSAMGGDGTYEFYSVATDGASRQETAASTPDASTIVDTVAPVSSTNPLPAFITSPSFLVTAAATDATSGLTGVELFVQKDGGSWTSYGTDATPPFSWTVDTVGLGGDGDYAFRTVAADAAGHTEAVPSVPDASTTVDTVAPTALVDPLPAYTVSGFAVRVTAFDATSGVASVELWYRKDGGPWTSLSLDTVPPYEWALDPAAMGGDGRYEFRSEALDAAGNAEGSAAAVEASTIFDATPPESTHTIAGTEGKNRWFVTQASVALVATDATSGIDRLEYRVNQGAWRAFSDPFLLGNGIHVVEYRAADRAGNAEPPNVFEVRVDTTPPDVAIALPSSRAILTDSEAVLEWSGSDGVSGVQRFEVLVDDRFLSAFAPDARSFVADLPDGEHTITVRAFDEAGNEAQAVVSIRVDTTRLDAGPARGLWFWLGLAAALGLFLALGAVWRRKDREEPGAVRPTELFELPPRPPDEPPPPPPED